MADTEPFVNVRLDGVLLLVLEREVSVKFIRPALIHLMERLGDRKVSIAIATTDPPTEEDRIKADDDVTLLRTAFGADQGEPMEEAARRVVRIYVNRTGRLPTEKNAVVEAAMLVCRPGPGWSIDEACAILRRDKAP